MFTVPSDPPSTPDSRRDSSNFPSTTPAGPPPSNYTNNSFTPAGLPPSTVFGSSQLQSGAGNLGRPAFNASGRLGSHLFGKQTKSSNGTPAHGTQKSNMFQDLGSSPPKRGAFTQYDDDDDDEYEDDEDAEGDEEEMEEDNEDGAGEDDMTDDEENVPRWNLSEHAPPQSGPTNAFNLSTASSLFDPHALQDSRMRDSRSAPIQSVETHIPAAQDRYDFAKLALGLSSKSTMTELFESDGLILEQEHLFQELYGMLTAEQTPTAIRMLHTLSRELPRVWTPQALQSQTLSKSEARPRKLLQKANYVASLLLQLYHPPNLPTQQELGASLFGRSSANSPSGEIPIPRVLLDWLNMYHVTWETELDTVLSQRSKYSSSPAFWDAVMGSCLRGRFEDTIKLLRDANFAVAHTAIQDGGKTPGYRGSELTTVEKVVDDAIIAIEACPALKYGDWNVQGDRWRMYRRKIAQAILTLREYSEGASYDRSAMRSGRGPSVSAASRRAESQVPWTVYENLLIVYEHLLGNSEELISSSADWVEATIALTAWWDGEEEQDVPYGSLVASRLSLSKSQRGRTVDDSPRLAYRRRLNAALSQVINTEDEEFEINPTDIAQVAMACLFEDRLEATLSCLRCFSISVAAAVEQIASIGKWGHSASRDIMRGFDKSDLMVLSMGRGQSSGDLGEVVKDEQMVVYAECLSRRESFVGEAGNTKEGWQLAMQVLSRLDNVEAASNAISDLLDSLELDSTDRVDKIVLQLNEMGFAEQADSVAERYADTIASNTYDYGPTLIYYARAHNIQKLHSILDILISLSLVNSTAYPPINELDTHLRSLLLNPKKTLGSLSLIDQDAAELLATSLSGYATVRKFYDLRDEEIYAATNGTKPAHRPLARRRAATDALMTLIASASTPIRGGLYDPDSESVLQVDGLLVLLGEALPLLKLDPCPVSMVHLNTLLAAIEDIVSSPSLIRDQCGECLRSTLATAHGIAESSDPRDLLKKSVSALSEKTGASASSQFSLVGSSLLSGSGENSAVLTGRAWDWRRGFKPDTKMEDVISVLRVTVADVVAKAWIEDDGFDEYA